jgi:uncharacterized protein YeaO (DUF488 family)
LPIKTRRWNDPASADDGLRLLVCRIRPRGVSKTKETWDEWWPDLGPSRALLDEFHGKSGPPLPWDDYARRFVDEMGRPGAVWRLRALAGQLARGETITLLCSSACTDPARCHRTILAGLLERTAP